MSSEQENTKPADTATPSPSDVAAGPGAPPADAVHDATLCIVISGGPADGKQITLDLVLLRVVLEKVEREHPIDEKYDGSPAPEFLTAWAAELGSLGDFECSPSVAYQVWQKATERFVALKRKHELASRLAWHYGAAALALSEEEQLGLTLNLDARRAEDVIHRGDYDPADVDAVYELFMEAYGDPSLAERQARAAQRRYIDEQCAK